MPTIVVKEAERIYFTTVIALSINCSEQEICGLS